MKTIKKPKLPEKLFGRMENDGEGGTFPLVDEDINAVKEDGADVGTYELTEVRRFKLLEVHDG